MEGEPLAAVDDSLQLAGGPVAEEGTGSAGEDGGQPPPLLGDPGMTDRVDAAMEPVKVAVCGPASLICVASCSPTASELATG